MKSNEHEGFWVALTDTADTQNAPGAVQQARAASRLPSGAALTEPGFPGDPPQPGYTLPPSPLMVHSPTDPEGSWTGVPQNENEVPVQDADDL